MNWFKDCTTVEEVKKLYRQLAMQYHPDRPGGDTAMMQQINDAYHKALKAQDGKFVKADKETGDKGFTYRYDEAKEEAIIEKIGEVIRSGILDGGVEVYLIGMWLWAVGDTRPHRQTLGRDGLKFSWHAQRKCWYWHLPQHSRRYNAKADLADIAAKYGAERVVNRDEEKKAMRPA